MAYTAKGKVVCISPLRQFTSKAGTAYQSQDVAIALNRYDPNTGEPFPDENNTPKFNFFGEKKTAQLAGIAVGQEVAIDFELRGRSYVRNDGTADYAVDLDGIRIQPLAAAPASVERASAKIPAPAADPIANPGTASSEPEKPIDDLPF